MSYCNPINFKIKADAAAVGSEYLKYFMFNTNRPFQ